MKANGKIQSRRALLQIGVHSLAGAGILGTLEQVAGAATAPDHRALVCIYLFGGEGGSYLPDVAELKALHRQEVLMVKNVAVPALSASFGSTPGEMVARQYQSLRFLPNGFATPEWAAQNAGISARAFTFQCGMSMLPLAGRRFEGDQFENATLRLAMNSVASLRTTFPDTTIGRQLEDVSRLLQAGSNLGLHRPVFLCTANGFTRSAERAGTLGARYRELGQAMAAFHAATVELGVESQVTSYTDAEFSLDSSTRRTSRMILGGAAKDAEVLKATASAADTYSASLVRWHAFA